MRTHPLVLVLTGLLFALHGSAAAAPDYDMSRTLILDGEVKSVDWSGEQLRMVFWSNDGYDGADWALSGPKTAALLAMGWTRDMVKAGDRIDAVIHADRTSVGPGRRAANGLIVRFLMADGSTLETGPRGTQFTATRDLLNQRFDNPADDPMSSYYGNTAICRAEDPKGPVEANYWCQNWFDADHTRSGFSVDKNADGTWHSHLENGVWWLERQHTDNWTMCTLVTNSLKPRCHNPAIPRKVGDKWSIVFHGAKNTWTEYRELRAGRGMNLITRPQ